MSNRPGADCQAAIEGVRQAPLGHKVEGMRGYRVQRKGGRAAAALIIALALPLGGCLGETFQRGYVLPEGALEQIPLGASQEQVLIVLGTPSTVATVSGEAFYYISQKAERPVAFMPTQITDQRVIAVYFDKNRRVARVASYGMKDGEVFDFVSRTTPTAGNDINILKSMLQSLQGAHIGLPF
jgi:outer membrane protein assembly factor BamE (lipoprotein component of BamABCDE complex)